jgi:hypothetical protein
MKITMILAPVNHPGRLNSTIGELSFSAHGLEGNINIAIAQPNQRKEIFANFPSQQSMDRIPRSTTSLVPLIIPILALDISP